MSARERQLEITHEECKNLNRKENAIILKKLKKGQSSQAMAISRIYSCIETKLN